MAFDDSGGGVDDDDVADRRGLGGGQSSAGGAEATRLMLNSWPSCSRHRAREVLVLQSFVGASSASAFVERWAGRQVEIHGRGRSFLRK